MTEEAANDDLNPESGWAAAPLQAPCRHPGHDNPDRGDHHGSRNSAQETAA